MRDAAVEAGKESEQWDRLSRRFEYAFQGILEPWRVHNGVLLVRRPPLDVLALQADEHTNERPLYKEVCVEIRDRSATAEDIASYYERCLSRYGLSHVRDRGTFSYYAGEDGLKILLRPEEEESLHPFPIN
jgi:hypothetical protein